MMSLVVIFCLLNSDEVLFLNAMPDDQQILISGSALSMPKQVFANNDYLFVIDQAEHAVLMFNHQDQYLKRFGGIGQGPGKLYFPHWAVATKDELVVSDKTGRFHFFLLSGDFVRSRPFPEFYARYVRTVDGWFTFALNPRNDNRFALLNNEFEKQKSIKDIFYSPLNNPIQDNRVNVRYESERIYILQAYASGFRIYDNNGNLIRKGNVSVSPFDDPEFKDVKSVFTHRTFDVFKGHFIASYYAIGALKFLVFDDHGNIINRVKMPINNEHLSSKEQIYVMDMEILVGDDGINDLWVLTQRPTGLVLHYKFKDEFFLKSKN